MELEIILLVGEEWLARLHGLGPSGLAAVLVFLVSVLLIQMAILSLVFSSMAAKAVENVRPVQHGHSQVLTPFHSYRTSSPNSWICRLLTSWGFLTPKVTANGNGLIALLSVRTSGECSPGLMNHWDYLGWKLRGILLAVTINIHDYKRLSFHWMHE